MQDYIERLMQRELLAEQMKLKELRSDEETAQATDLLSLILVPKHTQSSTKPTV